MINFKGIAITIQIESFLHSKIHNENINKKIKFFFKNFIIEFNFTVEEMVNQRSMKSKFIINIFVGIYLKTIK